VPRHAVDATKENLIQAHGATIKGQTESVKWFDAGSLGIVLGPGMILRVNPLPLHTRHRLLCGRMPHFVHRPCLSIHDLLDHQIEHVYRRSDHSQALAECLMGLADDRIAARTGAMSYAKQMAECRPSANRFCRGISRKARLYSNTPGVA
jgi:hypothetical protein